MGVIYPWRHWESVLSWVSAKNIACCPLCIKLQFRRINPSRNLSPNAILAKVSMSFGLPSYSILYSHLSSLFPPPPPSSLAEKQQRASYEWKCNIKEAKHDCERRWEPGPHRWPRDHNSICLNYLTLPPDRHVIWDNALLLSAPIWMNSSPRNEIQQQSLSASEKMPAGGGGRFGEREGL